MTIEHIGANTGRPKKRVIRKEQTLSLKLIDEGRYLTSIAIGTQLEEGMRRLAVFIFLRKPNIDGDIRNETK